MKIFSFYKSAPDTVWNVAHNLNTTVVVNDVMVNTVDGVEKILPSSVEMVDSNNLQITFTSARSGYVRIVAGDAPA